MQLSNYKTQMQNNYLMHFGVPGMKWGRRKQRPVSSTGSRNVSQSQQKEARKAKAKRAVKIGVAVAGTALAAYGASKLIKNKNMKIQTEKGKKAADKYIRDHERTIKSATTYKNGVTEVYAKSKKGSLTYTTKNSIDQVRRSNDVYNASVREGGRGIYKHYVNNAKKANTRQAAKNVVKYYKNKRK